MEQDLLGLAFGAGLVAALNPCGFALLPGYLALVVRGDHSVDGARAVVRAVARAALATVAMAAGFIAVFGSFTALTVAAASTVQRYLPYVTVVIGLTLVCLGVWLLAGRHLGVLMPNALANNPRWAPTAHMGSMLGYGVGYALASLSCTIGPFLAVTGAGLRSETPLHGVGVFAAYAAGFTLVVGVLAVATALARTVVIDRMRRVLPYANRIGGVLLVLVGAYVAYYGLYEVRLFGGSGDPADPVIAVAGRIQGTLAGWVHQHGALPWLIGLLGLLSIGLLWRGAVRFSGRRSAARPATADDAP
ncbi:cytochrome c biogenesis CcdA family protein [Mycolicibacterium goodii]|uniref:Cytochrome c biogenesis CcdA family protein n=1 Tax=Mycolicibacterium goodii TaxID=134601 RepID=A0ABS6HW77_MYCGD|nr:cytochrome c biogenesis CcdA family protein [Mycolicibacterium goodii]MBU8812639.1 cytochrome c biogenesis CcdA family protein [Mycolicibacterium goodii]MBU8826195.1 cytochrome c biogenesis CcdA family protein [Mycolicibacterium goodii]MBU8839494.1 cytochrome c biogenesis CcdA family protein [Mycolicibacterium goodii]